MAKKKTVFRCQVCGKTEPKWVGRCPECLNWDVMVEEAPAAPRPDAERRLTGSAPISLPHIDPRAEDRQATGSSEFDRVLGGGIMAGSVVLLGGDPGIGKSTLMLQIMGALSAKGLLTLYVSGEESARQIRLRADRLGVDSPNLYILTETGLEAILARVNELNPVALVLDSVQTLAVESLPSTPGSLVQVRESAARAVTLAKTSGRPVFMIGHVTKSGSLAGPRVIEHLVDTVLYFEGDQSMSFRIVRAVKNRFGSTNEIGVFEMRPEGLKEVSNPSAVFLAERPLDQPGSVVVPCLEGTRPILVEIQALVSGSAYAQARRTSLGVDSNRVAMLSAVLERKTGLSLAGQDVFVNVAGGVRITEPGADLGLAAALASSLTDKPVDRETVFLGEIGLTGEIRSVSRAEIRLTEAGKLGFSRAVVPAALAKKLQKPPLKLIGVKNLTQALESVLD